MLNASLNAQHFLALIDHYRSSTSILVALRAAPYNGTAARDPHAPGLPSPSHRRPDVRATDERRDEALGPDRFHAGARCAEPLTDDAVSALMPELRAVMREAADIARPFFKLGGQTSASLVEGRRIAGDRSRRRGGRLPEGPPQRVVPKAAWLSEETADDPARIGHDLVWIVDPIDGTRAFLSGHPDWSIAVALLAAGEPLIGFVHAPVGGTDYEAIRGRGATRNGEPIRVDAGSPGRLADHRPQADARPAEPGLGPAPDAFEVIDRIPSLALRLARVADGSVDVGMISGNARDWDLAAADLVLREAGGIVCGFDREATRYNCADPVHGELLAAPVALRDPRA